MSKLSLTVWDHIPIWNQLQEDGDPHISGSVSSVLPLGSSTTCTDSEFTARGQFLVEGSQR